MNAFDNTCRCCLTRMEGSDHCPECGCEEYEETCQISMVRLQIILLDIADDMWDSGDIEEGSGVYQARKRLGGVLREG